MAEYIERKAAFNAILKLVPKVDDDGYCWVIRGDAATAVDFIPAADVQPVRHGRWGHRWVCSNMTVYEYACCSECGKPTYRISTLEDMPPYCPNCGATMMDGEA